MNNFLQVNSIDCGLLHVNQTYHHLRQCGSEGIEGVVLWAGIVDKNRFIVKDTIIPAQKGYQLEEGLLYSVEGEELHRINMWLYKNAKTLMVQVHSHPSRAYHSETDDRFPIISQLGGISIVIPNFGFDAFSVEDWAVYRLFAKSGWTELSPAEKNSLFKIT